MSIDNELELAALLLTRATDRAAIGHTEQANSYTAIAVAHLLTVDRLLAIKAAER